ncbi:MAG: methyltransferase domain-containing protein [Acidimicrobiales bacterium]
MLVVTGKTTERVGPAEVEALLSGHERVHIDVGTGDGRLAYRWACADGDVLVMGLDATRDAMAEMAGRATRRPSPRNLTFVQSPVESPPPELSGAASSISVVMPWGSLLAGLVVPEPAVLSGLVSMARPGARVELVLNGEVWSDRRAPLESQALPEPTVERVDEVLRSSYAACGLAIAERGYLVPGTLGEVLRGVTEGSAGLTSTWVKRLSQARARPRFLHVRAIVQRPAAGVEPAGVEPAGVKPAGVKPAGR